MLACVSGVSALPGAISHAWVVFRRAVCNLFPVRSVARSSLQLLYGCPGLLFAPGQPSGFLPWGLTTVLCLESLGIARLSTCHDSTCPSEPSPVEIQSFPRAPISSLKPPSIALLRSGRAHDACPWASLVP